MDKSIRLSQYDSKLLKVFKNIEDTDAILRRLTEVGDIQQFWKNFTKTKTMKDERVIGMSTAVAALGQVANKFVGSHIMNEFARRATANLFAIAGTMVGLMAVKIPLRKFILNASPEWTELLDKKIKINLMPYDNGSGPVQPVKNFIEVRLEDLAKNLDSALIEEAQNQKIPISEFMKYDKQLDPDSAGVIEKIYNLTKEVDKKITWALGISGLAIGFPVKDIVVPLQYGETPGLFKKDPAVKYRLAPKIKPEDIGSGWTPGNPNKSK